MSNLVTYHHPSGLFSISYPSNDSIIQTQYPSFFPPIGSDNLFDSLRTVYSHCSDHASRIHAARTQAESWLQSITRMRLPSDGIHTPGSPDANADVQSFVTESTVETVPSLPLGPAHHGGGSSTVATSISMPSCSTGGSETGRVSAGARSQKSRSPPTQADMTFQWKLESHAPPGPGHGANSSSVALADGPTHSPLIESMARKANRAHFKRTLTEDEKVEFKRRRRIGACIDCRKKKKKVCETGPLRCSRPVPLSNPQSLLSLLYSVPTTLEVIYLTGRSSPNRGRTIRSLPLPLLRIHRRRASLAAPTCHPALLPVAATAAAAAVPTRWMGKNSPTIPPSQSSF